LRLGKPLLLIPFAFVFYGPQHFMPDMDKLPLGDVIAVNLDHYRMCKKKILLKSKGFFSRVFKAPAGPESRPFG
jgi:hypothetical protein